MTPQEGAFVKKGEAMSAASIFPESTLSHTSHPASVRTTLYYYHNRKMQQWITRRNPGTGTRSFWSPRLGCRTVHYPHVRLVESNEDTLLYASGRIPGAVRVDWTTGLNDKCPVE